MSTENQTKINQLLANSPYGVVLLSCWLKNQGYSLDLLKRYRNSQWITSIASGAMIRAGDHVDLYGAVYALQHEARLRIHIGARTALALQGKSHYLELAPTKAILFGAAKEKLPQWFKTHEWGVTVEYYATSLFSSDLGMIEYAPKNFSIQVSGDARAIMECLHLAPSHQELSECYELMESMNNLSLPVVQALLENCSSIKVKRLFLYLAEHFEHAWVKYLNTEKIDLGSGKRSIVKNGVLDKKYQITIPKEWAEHDRPRL